MKSASIPDRPADQFFRMKFSRPDHGQHFRIFVGLHAMAANDLKFVGDDLVHGDVSVPVIRHHQPDLDVPAALEAGNIEAIITRNLRDYRHSLIRVCTAGDYFHSSV